MKKIRAFILALVAATAAMAPLSSCSSDDNDDNNNGGGNTELPKYAALAAQYIIDDEQAAVRSIELTESGRYLVEMNQSYNGAPKRAAGVADDFLFYGKYTAGADNKTFYLDEFGTVEVNGDGTLTVVSNSIGGRHKWFCHDAHWINNLEKETAGAYDKLCRTWISTSARMYTKVNGRTIWDFSGNSLADVSTKIKDFQIKNGMINDEIENPEAYFDNEIKRMKALWPMEYTFTKRGTAIQKHGTSNIMHRQFKLTSRESMVTRWDENEEWKPGLFSEDISGPTKITFKGTLLTIEEVNNQDGIVSGTAIKFKEI